MPALAERRIDIPDLARHFMLGAARHAGLPPRPIGDDAMAVMQTADWPGDVRQLRNAVEWMLIMAPGEPGSPIGIDGLPPELDQQRHRPAWTRTPTASWSRCRCARRASISSAPTCSPSSQRFGGNISRTANFVGMERSALHRKLKTLGLHGDD